MAKTKRQRPPRPQSPPVALEWPLSAVLRIVMRITERVSMVCAARVVENTRFVTVGMYSRV